MISKKGAGYIFRKLLNAMFSDLQMYPAPFLPQEALLGLGYDIGDIDGVIGTNTRKAIKEFQQTQGLKADGKTSEKLVQQMRRVAQEKGLIRAVQQ